MSLFERPNGVKYHSRIIETAVFDYDEQRMVAEGCLTDRRYCDFYLASGERKPPGILHQMIIHLLINKSTYEIEDVRVEMPAFPRDECIQTANSLESLKGMTVTKGFTSKIKTMAGHGKGCTHLVELLTAMGPSMIQGVISHKVKDAPFLMPGLITSFAGSCYSWRADGPLIDYLKEKLKKVAPKSAGKLDGPH